MPTANAWAPGPLHPLFTDDAVHVWRADLAAVSPELEELLCDDERARAERFLSAPDGERWRRSRGLLRTLLGRYLQLEPRSLRFATGEYGKPALLPPPDHPAPASPGGVFFNLSHSDGLALYAFSQAGAVGIDVEVASRPIDAVAVAARMFGSAEAKRLKELDPAIRQREFLRAWVRYEARLKCLGVGIGASPAATVSSELWVAEIELNPPAAAAVAAEHPAGGPRCWDWQQ